MNERADHGTTKAMRAYLSINHKVLRFIGQNKNGEINYNAERAVGNNTKEYNNSIDVTMYDLYQDQGEPFPTGKSSGQTLTITRNEDGKIVSQEGVTVDKTLIEVFEMAEAAYKA